jgi:hypothetical protein
MAVVITQGEQVGISIDLETATKLASLIGVTASNTFGDFYDDLIDAGIKPMQYHVKTYGGAHVIMVNLEKKES